MQQEYEELNRDYALAVEKKTSVSPKSDAIAYWAYVSNAMNYKVIVLIGIDHYGK